MDLTHVEPLPTLSTSDLNAKGEIARTPIIDTLWPDGSLGFLGGPPKAGKSTYAIEEALCLAMGWPVLGQYKVPERQRVLFVEEEDEITKVNERVRALVRQRELDPDDASVAAELADSIRFLVQPGFVLNEPVSMARLRATIVAERAQVVYLDALWRMTDLDLERPHNVRQTLLGITQLSQELGVRFRVVHHTIKRVGKQTSGRELHGSQMLRGWALSSLMFGEPANGLTTISYDGKGGSMVPLCRMKILASQPAPDERSLFAGLEHAPLDDERTSSVSAEQTEHVLSLLGTLPRAVATDGQDGVEPAVLFEAVPVSKATGYRLLEQLKVTGCAHVSGTRRDGRSRMRLWLPGSAKAAA